VPKFSRGWGVEYSRGMGEPFSWMKGELDKEGLNFQRREGEGGRKCENDCG
jgi:hypothetical protein